MEKKYVLIKQESYDEGVDAIARAPEVVGFYESIADVPPAYNDSVTTYTLALILP